MLIDQEKCVGCGRCQLFCPAQAIYFESKKSKVDEDLCFECGACLRVEVCPVDAIYESEYVYQYPRSVRKFFSDPATSHKETGIPGRGTEEVKTNDITQRFKKGEIGIGLEVGRPTVGARLYEVKKITQELAKAGFNDFEEFNPVSGLMQDTKTGKLKEEVLNERVLSAIVEVTIKEEELEKCMEAILDIAKKTSTVFTMDLITRYDTGMKTKVDNIISISKFKPLKVAKINIGVGRRSNKELVKK